MMKIGCFLFTRENRGRKNAVLIDAPFLYKERTMAQNVVLNIIRSLKKINIDASTHKGKYKI